MAYPPPDGSGRQTQGYSGPYLTPGPHNAQPPAGSSRQSPNGGGSPGKPGFLAALTAWWRRLTGGRR